MKRIFFVHWNAVEAEERAGRPRQAGYDVDAYWKTDNTGLGLLRANPPDLILVDLSRVPSHGRAVATFLRRQKATRHVPVVFVGGVPEKVTRIRETLPDAVYAEWRGVRGALRQALASAPAAPVVPPATMAGYSGTPLAKKLGIRAGSVVALLNASPGFAQQLEPLPEAVRLQQKPAGANRMLLFARSQADLARRFPAAERALPEKGALWICWPKKASGIASDLSEPAVRAFGLARGLVDYKICAVDVTWSGLCFARRRKVE
jgi:CheY-like chemotaxis protein